MIRKLKICCFLLTLSLGWMGCESNIGLDFPPHQKELAVFCFFTPAEPWSVLVHQTFGLGEPVRPNPPFAVTNATVEILEDDVVVAQLEHVEGGLYSLPDVYPEAGVSYSIRVSAPDFPTVSGSDVIPSSLPPPILSLRDSVKTNPETRDILSELDLQISDPGDQTNYYSIEVFADYGAGTISESVTTENPTLLSTPFINLFGKDNEYLIVFDDGSFNGEQFTATVDIRRHVANSYSANILHLSEAYYRFLLSLAQIESSSENPFAEPVRPFSNLQGGQGVFAGYSVAKGAPLELNEVNLKTIASEYTSRAFFDVSQFPNIQLLPDQAFITLNLTADGGASGHIFVDSTFNIYDPTQTIDTDFEGTFAYDGTYVTLSLTPDIFLNDILWQYERGALRSPLEGEYFIVFQRE